MDIILHTTMNAQHHRYAFWLQNDALLGLFGAFHAEM